MMLVPDFIIWQVESHLDSSEAGWRYAVVKKITYAGLLFAVVAAGWAVIFARSPGQIFPDEMMWVFYLIVIPVTAQCGIFVEKPFWGAFWKDGVPVSPVLEKKWSDRYIVVRGICGQNRKFWAMKTSSGNSKYESLYNLSSTGVSIVMMSRTIKIGKVLIAAAVVLTIIKIIVSPIMDGGGLTVKGELATSWPIVWFVVAILQLALFMCANLFLYWMLSKAACLVRGEK
ncbi:hypothetical protein PQR53_08955 [Paraburkholderia fungorum]|jgi:hypothetical protein|uniref:hypothetical protein n=1 Tax=Paraburkholderia fungorum TaxID=134537 RepID=UPI0038BA4D13